jgi:hypothetical protein
LEGAQEQERPQDQKELTVDSVEEFTRDGMEQAEKGEGKKGG